MSPFYYPIIYRLQWITDVSDGLPYLLNSQNGQDQEHVKTIEADIVEALLKFVYFGLKILFSAKVMCKGETLYDIHWSRAGRTDKGVHAAMNVLGSRLHVFDTELAEIRAKAEENKDQQNKDQDGQEAEPASKRVKSSNGVPRLEGEIENRVADIMGSGEAYKHINIDRQLQYMRDNNILFDELDVKGLKVVEGRILDLKERINAHLTPQIRLLGVYRVNKHFDARTSCDSREYEYLLPTKVLTSSPKALSLAGIDPEKLNLCCEDKEKLRVLLDSELKKSYLGTHNFHNFTLNVAHNLAEAKRFIIGIGCSQIVTSSTLMAEGGSSSNTIEEFFRIELHGQSFLLHQIRKMIGTLVGQIRGDIPESAVSECLTSTKKMNTPLAPAEGLYLSNTHFEAYSDAKAQPPLTFPLDMEIPELLEAAEEVRKDLIYPEISKHARNGVWDDWLNGTEKWKEYMYREDIAKNTEEEMEKSDE